MKGKYMKTLPVSFKDVKVLLYNKAMADALAHSNKDYRNVLTAPKDTFVLSKEQFQQRAENFFKSSIDEVKSFINQK